MKSPLTYLIAVAVIGLSADVCLAHRMLLECRNQKERVHVEVFFDDDTPAAEAKVWLENDKQEIVASGKTDDKGVWNCPIPAPGEYLIRAESVGHAAKAVHKVPASNAAPSLTSTTQREAIQPTHSSKREEMTQVPWSKATLGVSLIGIIFGVLWIFRRRPVPR